MKLKWTHKRAGKEDEEEWIEVEGTTVPLPSVQEVEGATAPIPSMLEGEGGKPFLFIHKEGLKWQVSHTLSGCRLLEVCCVTQRDALMVAGELYANCGKVGYLNADESIVALAWTLKFRWYLVSRREGETYADWRERRKDAIKQSQPVVGKARSGSKGGP